MKKKIILFLIALLSVVLIGCSQKYRVTFNIYENNVTSQIVYKGDKIENFSPSMEGYTFLYWTYNDEEFKIDTKIDKNMTLVASWQKNDYLINFIIDENNSYDKSYEMNDLIKVEDPKKENYIFLGWYCNNKLYDFTKPITSEFTLIAKWALDSEYKIELNVSFNSTKANTKINDVKVNRLDCIDDLPVLSVDDSIFLGWYLDDNLVTSETIIKEITDFTLIAKWSSKNVTSELSFDTNGGDEITSQNIMYGTVVELPIPTREGYTFLYWALDGVEIDGDFLFNYFNPITIKAYWKSSFTEMKTNGENVFYRGSTTQVMIPANYTDQLNEFRAVWVSSYVSDFRPSSNKEIMMANLTSVLDKMEEYNMNAMIFHLRAANDAYYLTDLAPINPTYGTKETLKEWNYLEWLIDECHKRGIEFHAWLNPYRIKSSGYNVETTTEEISEQFKDYPTNPASKASNILKTYYSETSYGAILNPAKSEVQNYIVNVCKELTYKYDIDAIHFDDYFYAKLSSGTNIISEADQIDFESFIKGNPDYKYNKTSNTDKANWRRLNVSNFIKKLHNMLSEYNNTSEYYVQLGISPTGIWKNGNGYVSYDNNGLAITTGSNTTGYAHYDNPLYADTLLWANNGWIDYLLPQTYWEISNRYGPYPDLVDWWCEALKNVKTKLYLGIGIYKSFSSSAGSWYTDKNELTNQVLYAQKYDKISGICFFSYKQILTVEDNVSCTAYNALKQLKDEFWTTKVKTPSYR